MKDFLEVKGRFCNQIKNIFDSNLVSVLLYGSYVRGDYIPKKSDINIMIVRIKRKNQELIDLNKILKKYRKWNLAVPLVLTQNELQSSTDVYPMEYIDIKDYHEVLFGNDVFKSLKFDLKNLRLELENQVKSKLIHLREFLINYYQNKRSLRWLLLNTVSSLLVISKNIIRLHKKEINNDPMQLLDSVKQITGCSLTTVINIINYKRGVHKYSKKELLNIYLKMIKELEKLADYVDQFKVKGK